VVKTLVILQRYFLYNRSLLSELSRCAWEALRVFFREAVPQGDAMPGAVIAIQTFGQPLRFAVPAHTVDVSIACAYMILQAYELGSWERVGSVPLKRMRPRKF